MDEMRKLKNWLNTSDLNAKRLASLELAEKQLAALHDVATKHNPRTPTPERTAAFSERIKSMTPEDCERVLGVIMTPDEISVDEWERIGKLWDAWDAERDPQVKALLQMQLGECVAGLISHVEFLKERAHRLTETMLDWRRQLILLTQGPLPERSEASEPEKTQVVTTEPTPATEVPVLCCARALNFSVCPIHGACHRCGNTHASDVACSP